MDHDRDGSWLRTATLPRRGFLQLGAAVAGVSVLGGCAAAAVPLAEWLVPFLVGVGGGLATDAVEKAAGVAWKAITSDATDAATDDTHSPDDQLGTDGSGRLVIKVSRVKATPQDATDRLIFMGLDGADIRMKAWAKTAVVGAAHALAGTYPHPADVGARVLPIGQGQKLTWLDDAFEYRAPRGIVQFNRVGQMATVNFMENDRTASSIQVPIAKPRKT